MDEFINIIVGDLPVTPEIVVIVKLLGILIMLYFVRDALALCFNSRKR